MINVKLELNYIGLENATSGTTVVDFANEYPGGGIFSNGSAQEELLFCAFPEMQVSRFFTEKLMDNEVVVINGPHKYNKMGGYGPTFAYHQSSEEEEERFSKIMRKSIYVKFDTLISLDTGQE